MYNKVTDSSPYSESGQSHPFKSEATISPEMSAAICQSTWCYIQEDTKFFRTAVTVCVLAVAILPSFSLPVAVNHSRYDDVYRQPSALRVGQHRVFALCRRKYSLKVLRTGCSVKISFRNFFKFMLHVSILCSRAS